MPALRRTMRGRSGGRGAAGARRRLPACPAVRRRVWSPRRAGRGGGVSPRTYRPTTCLLGSFAESVHWVRVGATVRGIKSRTVARPILPSRATTGGGMARLKQMRAMGLVLVVGAMVAGACSSSKGSGGAAKANTAGVSASSGGVHQGGDVVVAADQEPDCMDWIGSCAGSSWGAWMADVTTMPHAYVYTDSGYQPGDVLTGEATVVTSPKQVVTYHINPKAVWSDGQPITSADFKYTWDQIAQARTSTTRAATRRSRRSTRPTRRPRSSRTRRRTPTGRGCSAACTASCPATSSRARTATPR